MIKGIGVLLLVVLSGCSGVSKVCDKEGTCLETWRSVSATSAVTVSQLRTPHDTPVVGTTVSTTNGGIVSYFDPLAHDANVTSTEIKAFGGL